MDEKRMQHMGSLSGCLLDTGIWYSGIHFGLIGYDEPGGYSGKYELVIYIGGDYGEDIFRHQKEYESKIREMFPKAKFDGIEWRVDYVMQGIKALQLDILAKKLAREFHKVWLAHNPQH